MKERREGSTRIIEYREGYEIRVAIAGVWWSKIGGRLIESCTVLHAMRAIDRVAGPHPRKPLPAPTVPVVQCSSDRARWRAAYNIPPPESD
jgi:hypothetical protein